MLAKLKSSKSKPKKITKAVILAAGMGTRFFPATKSISKEMLPIVDKPCIQYLVEEAVASGIKEICIITSPDETSIQEHFKTQKKLRKNLQKAKKNDRLKEIEKIDKLAKFHFAIQKKPGGDGNAILSAKSFIKNDPCAILFGDDIYDSRTPALKQLIQQFEKTQESVIALTKIDKKDSEKYGIVKVSESKSSLHKLSGFVEKPSPKKAPSNLAITGKYIITPELFKKLKSAKPTHKDGELRLIDAMIQYIKKSPIYGYELKGQRFDTGDKFGYLQAVINFSLKHPKLKAQMKKHLKELDLK